MATKKTEQLTKFDDWQDLTVNNLLGGLVLDTDTEVLENNEFSVMENWLIRDKKFRRDTGYTAYLGPVRGNPRRHFSYVLPNGTIHELLITDLTVYRKANDQWRYVSNGTSTTLSGNEAAGQTVLSVADISGFADNDYVGVILDTGQMHFSQINGAPGGGTITIDDALPSAAASGNAVINSVVLAGAAHKHITARAIPWNEWVVFTNGVDNLKRFDPTLLTVVDVPGLTDTVCQTLELYDNSILIGNTTESGVRFPFRYRYSAKGDGTAWTTLEAGSTDIMDSSHDIIQMLILGPDLILYRDKSIARVSISSSGVRRFDTITTISGIGIFSNLGVIDLIDKHIVWANDNFYWYRGGFSIEAIGNPIKDHVFGPAGMLTHVEGGRGQSFAVLLPKVNEILFFHHSIAGEDHVNMVIRYMLDYNKWAHRVFADTFSGWGEHIVSDSVTWDNLNGGWLDQVSSWTGYEASGERYDVVLCSADDLTSHLYDFQASDDDGTVITAIAETKDFADPTDILRHDSLTIGVANGSLRVDYSTDKGQTWTLLGQIVAGATPQAFTLFAQFSSRLFRYRFTTTDPVLITYFSIHYKYDYES